MMKKVKKTAPQNRAAALLFAATALCTVSAFASGSMSTNTSNNNDAYATGKSVFFKQVACTTCPYAGRGKDAGDAKALRDQINMADSKLKLSRDDKDAVNAYLNERFRLSSMSNNDKK
jgi:hypothetical protein